MHHDAKGRVSPSLSGAPRRARSSRRTSPSTDLVRAIATLRESIAMKALNHVRTSDGIDLCEYRRCLGRGSKADAAEARQLQGGAPQIGVARDGSADLGDQRL